MISKVNNTKQKVSKIAFLNPYLPAGHYATAEIETTARLIQAGKNINVEVKAFGGCEEIEYFEPDFVFVMCFQAPKLTRFPTYGHMDVPISMIAHVPRFLRNVLTWDGCFAISVNSSKWLNELHLQNNKKFHFARAGVSVPRTQFKPADYQNAVAMYIGTNWDGQRHNELFGILNSGEYLKCYGPKKSWAKYPAALYGGEVPFDGVSALAAYNRSAAGLCIGHPAFDSEGTPSSRTYEIAAASAVPICSDIQLNRTLYGETALYVDKSLATTEFAAQIVDQVKWIRSHPKQAAEMAEAAHAIFNKNLSMEVFLSQLIEMHEQVLIDNHHFPVKSLTKKTVSSTKVIYILAVKYVDYRLQPILENLLSQTYNQIEIILLAKNGQQGMQQHFAAYLEKLHLTYLPDHDDNHVQLRHYLNEAQPTWLGIITLSGRLFPNHIAELMDGYQRYGKDEQITGIFASSLEYSDEIHLPELEPEEHIVANEYRLRMASLKNLETLPIHSVLLNFAHLNTDVFNLIDLYHPTSATLIKWLQANGTFMHMPEVTCATKINNDADLLRQVAVAKQTIADMQRVITNQNQAIADLNLRSQLLDLVQGSRTWRYTAFLRKLLKKCIHLLRRIKEYKRRLA